MHKRDFVLSAVGLSCSTGWLVMLQATAFNAVTVSIGLLGVLMVIGRSQAATR